jgi:hypothetical protein
MRRQQWVIEVKQTILESLPMTDAVGMDPAWAQFWASVLGLVVAIGVPLSLHIRERGERRAEKEARAKTYVISILTDVLLVRSLLDSAEKHSQDDAANLLDKVATIVRLSPALIAVMPLLHELGPASDSMQKAIASIKRLEQIEILGAIEMSKGGGVGETTLNAAKLFIGESAQHLKDASDQFEEMLK